MVTDDRVALTVAARAAWKFVLPLVEITSPRIRAFVDDGASMNRLSHKRELVDHRSRTAPAPNNDTLYSAAHLDLSAGPVEISLPPTGDRYISVSLMDAWSNNISVRGTRTHRGQDCSVRLAGPGSDVRGEDVIVSPTRYVWCLARVLVDGAADLPAAHKVQDGIRLSAPAVPGMTSDVDGRSGWAHYFSRAAELLRDNPPLPADDSILREIAPLGLDHFDPARFDEAQASAIETGIQQAREDLAQVRTGTIAQGWSYPAAHLGNFATDYDFRALVAMMGIGALPPQEAMYIRALGDLKSALFDGTRQWQLHFPAGQPIPVDGFWSLSLYEVTPDGRLFFTENPIDRFAIGDRTPGLARNPDESLDLWIGHERPQGNFAANWLPAPVGPFALILRAYLPQPALGAGHYRLPRIQERIG